MKNKKGISNRFLNIFGSFNYFGFKINLECSQQEYDDPTSGAKTVLTHEYVHYLQAVTTPYGIWRTIKLLDVINLSFMAIQKESKVNIPLSNTNSDEIKTAILKYENHRKNTCLGLDTIKLDTPLEDYRLFTKEYKDLVNATVHTMHYFPNQDNSLWIPLSQISL